MTIPLSGLGMFVWLLPKCEKGNLVNMVRRAKACNIRWLAIKAGDSHPNGQLSRKVTDFFRSMDIEVAGWWYSKPQTTAAELRLVQQLLHNVGINHFIIDAEIEWETVKVGSKRIVHNWQPEARVFAQEIRDALGPDRYLADAPWAKSKLHPLFPFKAFGAVCDARMPQFYWKLAAQDPSIYLPKCDAQWQDSKVPVCPLGSNVDFGGSQHGPLEDISAFLDRYEAVRPAFSLWSWQHIDLLEWQLLKERAVGTCPPKR